MFNRNQLSTLIRSTFPNAAIGKDFHEINKDK